jgi:enterochelin esterase-like enzyme
MNFKFLEALLMRSVLMSLFIGASYADGTLTNDIRISSDVLGYDLQYRLYLPEGYDMRTDHPVMFLTDGQNYIRRGNMPSVLDTLINNGQIEPVIAVFVDARDPDNLESNRRRKQFFCNEDYLKFFVDELIPTMEQNYPVLNNREGRSIMGLSFGGLNAACFGMLGHDIFSGIAMQSPANHPVPNLLPTYQQMPTLALRIFLSTGTPDDNTQANRQFHSVLKNKGYDMKYIEVMEGHNWDNWGPLLDDALLYFYGKRSN